MKSIARFLLAALCAVPFGADCATPVPATRGSNLTAYNGGSGATNNNNWNGLLNSRTGVDAAEMPPADFGNCNAIVLRCAQPKCANGGCTNMDVTYAIVSGCVQSNDSCKKYGDDLIQYISAQLVAQSTAKANAAAAAAQTAAANAAAQQNAQQMAQMQAQMQQMQAEMAQQNAETVAQLQSALEEQKQLTAQAIADANAARTPTVTTTAPATSGGDSAAVSTISGLSVAQQIAAQNGVSADVLAREQVTGQIMSSIENAEKQMEELKRTMLDVFDYAGCDTKGNNCSGPKRVKMFKQKAIGFFDPYENVLDELYDALILAQSVGVDITDIYMMLNGSCNVWGKYLCGLGNKVCDSHKITKDGNDITISSGDCHYKTPEYKYGENCDKSTGKSIVGGVGVRGGFPCVEGQIVPPEDDITCTLQKTIVDNKDDPVQRDWLWAEANDDSGANVRVGCASSALEASNLFRNRKKQAAIDVETLEKIISQDAPTTILKYRRDKNIDESTERTMYCTIGDRSYTNLQKWVATKTLPTNICMSETAALRQINSEGLLTPSGERVMMRREATDLYNKCTENNNVVEDCKVVNSGFSNWGTPDGTCCAAEEAYLCIKYAGGKKWTQSSKTCECSDGNKTYRKDYIECLTDEEYCAKTENMYLNNTCVSCDKWCTTDTENGPDRQVCGRDISGKSVKLLEGKRCKASWDKAENKCKCEAK